MYTCTIPQCCAHSICTTCTCSFGTLVNVWKKSIYIYIYIYIYICNIYMYIYVCISVYISVYMLKFSNECFSFECWRWPLNKTDQRIYSSVTRIFPACKGVRFLSLYINIMTSEQQKGAAFQTPHDLVTSFWTSNRTKKPQFIQAGLFFRHWDTLPVFALIP